MQQTLQAILAQKQQVELEKTDVDQTVNEVQKLPDDAVIYKAIGSVLVKGDKAQILSELTERRSLLDKRREIVAKQEERLRAQLKEVQTKLQEELSSAKSSP